MRRDSVVDFAHLDIYAVTGQIGPDRDGVVGWRETGLFKRAADLASIDIESARDLDILGTITAEICSASDRWGSSGPQATRADSAQGPEAETRHSYLPQRLLAESSPFSSSVSRSRRGENPPVPQRLCPPKRNEGRLIVCNGAITQSKLYVGFSVSPAIELDWQVRDSPRRKKILSIR